MTGVFISDAVRHCRREPWCRLLVVALQVSAQYENSQERKATCASTRGVRQLLMIAKRRRAGRGGADRKSVV